MLSTYFMIRRYGERDPRAFFLHQLHASSRFMYRRKRNRDALFRRVDRLCAQVPPQTEEEKAGRVYMSADRIAVPLSLVETAKQTLLPGAEPV